MCPENSCHIRVTLTAFALSVCWSNVFRTYRITAMPPVLKTWCCIKCTPAFGLSGFTRGITGDVFKPAIDARPCVVLLEVHGFFLQKSHACIFSKSSISVKIFVNLLEGNTKEGKKEGFFVGKTGRSPRGYKLPPQFMPDHEALSRRNEYREVISHLGNRKHVGIYFLCRG